MKLLAQVPEQPIKEDWQWLSNAMVSDNGKEQRVCNSSLPKPSYSLSLQFDAAADLRAHVAGMFTGAKGKFQVPLYQYGTRLKAVAAIGATVLSINTRRTELRIGSDCLIFDRSGYEQHTVQDFDAVSVTLVGGLVRAFDKTASICPVRTVYAANNAAIKYGRMDYDASATLNVFDAGFVDPFVNPYNDVAIATLNGVPILERTPTGGEFADTFDTGIKTTDEGGIPQIRSPWSHSQIVMQRSFVCDRFFSPLEWDYWRKFADTVKGSWKPFYMPTYRGDFGLTVPPVAGGSTLTFTGAMYHDDFFPYAPFKQVAIFHSGGVHYAAVTACALAGGNSGVTFAPALPAGVTVDRVSMLLKLRIADDKVSCEHYSLYSLVNLALRTVDA
jgi:hypothetical protein